MPILVDCGDYMVRLVTYRKAMDSRLGKPAGGHGFRVGLDEQMKEMLQRKDFKLKLIIKIIKVRIKVRNLQAKIRLNTQ